VCAVIIEESIRIPDWVSDLASFRKWARSPEFPQSGRLSYLDGEVWVDMSPERLFSHNRVKTEFTSVLALLVKQNREGMLFSDRTLLSNTRAGLSTEPDALYVSHESIRGDRVHFIEGMGEDYVEIEGTPDLVLEVVSPKSVHKDTKRLLSAYGRAGVREYWLVDARGGRTRFSIFRLSGRRGYVPVPKENGWLASEVFGKSFKLTVKKGELGYPDFTLSVR